MRNSKRFAILKRDTVTCCQVAGVENVVPRACHIVERGTTATSPIFSAHLMSDAGKGPLLRVISFTINILRRIPQRVGSLADTDSMPCLSILEPWHLFHNSHISYELLVCILCQFRRSKHDQHEMLYISCKLSRADIYPWEFRLGRCEESAGSGFLHLCVRRAGPAPGSLPGCSGPIGCTVVRPDREHFQEASEGHGVQRQSARSSLRTVAGAGATKRGCAARNGSPRGATVSGRRLSQRPRRVLGGNPCSWSDSPAPAVDGQNHQHACWPDASLGSASRSPRNPNFTRPYCEAPVATAQRVRSSETETCRLSNRSLLLLSAPSV